MAVGGLFALFDDIALLMKKAAGVTGDDFAVSAGQCHGLPPHREIPVLWRITKGSLINKAILVGVLLLVEYFMPILALGMLVLGACYIAFEAGEKVLGWMGIGEHEEAHETSPKTEDEMVKGALRTDMVLSAEIMIISLAAAGEASFEYKALLLVLVGFFVTLIIYGIVALLVRLDDMGFALMRSPTAFVQHIGKGMTHAAPKIMEALGVGGTIAIFMVAGGIFRHTLPFVHEYGAFLHVLPEIFADIAVGFVSSLVLVGFMQIGHLVRGKKKLNLVVDKQGGLRYNGFTVEKQRNRKMRYTLITRKGKIYQFYIRQLADTYQRAYGGVVFDETILDTKEREAIK